MIGISRFEHPEYLHLLWGLIPIIAFALLYIAWRKKAIKRLGDPKFIERQLRQRRFIYLHLGIFVLGLTFLVFTLANPQKGAAPQKIKKEGLDMVIALDVSASMQAEDIKPNRLDRAKLFISELAEQLEGNNVGLVVFAANAYIQMPLTPDPSALRMYLNTISTDMIKNQGTAIGDALMMGQVLLVPPQDVEQPTMPSAASKVILLISDGENHEDDAFEEARNTKENGVTVFTIGAGTREGGLIPIYHNNRLNGYLRDKTGEQVMSRLDGAMLEQIAKITGGNYYSLEDGNEALNGILNELGNLQTEEREVEVYTSYDSLFQWYLGIALALFLIDYLLYVLSRPKAIENE